MHLKIFDVISGRAGGGFLLPENIKYEKVIKKFHASENLISGGAGGGDKLD